MTPAFKNIASALLFMLSNLTLSAQSTKTFDSIAIRNNPQKELTYRVQNDLLNKVQFSKSHPKHVQIKGKHVFGDFGRGLLTLVSGVSVGNTKEDVDLKFTSRVKCNEEKYNWTVNLFVKGLYEKERNRYSTESGGFSMDIDRYAEINWDRGANGEIVRKEKRIGEFVLIKRPKFDKLSKNDPLEFLNDSVPDLHESDNISTSDERSYVIYGSLYNRDFSIVANTKKERYWLFSDGKLKTVLQLPLSKRLVEDKNTYALLDPDMSDLEATYWIKLALYNAYLGEIITKSSYNW